MQPASRQCPECSLLSPPNAETCECGYGFAAGKIVRGPLPRRAKPKLSRWELVVLLLVVALVALLVVPVAWLLLTLGAGETTPIVPGPVTLGPDWKVLTPAQPIECDRPRRYVELTFPVRGPEDGSLETIRRVRNANPELVLEDVEGREYRYRLDGEAYQPGASRAVVSFLSNTPEVLTLKSLRIRAAETLTVPQIVLACHNDSL